MIKLNLIVCEQAHSARQQQRHALCRRLFSKLKRFQIAYLGAVRTPLSLSRLHRSCCWRASCQFAVLFLFLIHPCAHGSSEELPKRCTHTVTAKRVAGVAEFVQISYIVSDNNLFAHADWQLGHGRLCFHAALSLLHARFSHAVGLFARSLAHTLARRRSKQLSLAFRRANPRTLIVLLLFWQS